MSEKVKPVLSARVDQRLIDRIDKLVGQTGVSRADVIERALGVGLADQEQFVKELQGIVRGPMMELVMNPKFLNVIFALTGNELDQNQITAIRNVRGRRGKGKTVTE